MTLSEICGGMGENFLYGAICSQVYQAHLQMTYTVNLHVPAHINLCFLTSVLLLSLDFNVINKQNFAGE